jgi:outer membrane protein
MKGFVAVLIVAPLALILSAAPVLAQAAQQPPAQPRPAPPAGTQPPPAPAPTIGQQQQQQQQQQPPAPFPVGAKTAFINPQRIFQESTDGKAAVTRINNLIQKKQNEGQERQKALQANQQKLQTSGGVMNEQARAQLEKEIEKQQVDGQRFQQDAQAEIQELQNEVQQEFIKKVSPLIEAVAKEKGLQMVFDLSNAGLAWWDPGLDLTNDVIKKLDAGGNKGAVPPKN